MKNQQNTIIDKYLGDSVYLRHDLKNGILTLYLNNGYGPTNQINLEPEVQLALIEYFESFVKQKSTNKEE